MPDTRRQIIALGGRGFSVERRPTYHQLLLNGEITPGFALDDGAAIHFINTEVHRVVASRRGAKAYRVCAAHGAVQEEPMLVDDLPHPQGGK